MKELTIYDLSDKPVCIDCRFSKIEKSNGWTEIGCIKVVISSGRDFVSGEGRKHKEIDAGTARIYESMCGLDGRWFEPNGDL